MGVCREPRPDLAHRPRAGPAPHRRGAAHRRGAHGPLFYLRDGEDLVVCNVNPGFERTNPWVLNLRAAGLARVQLRGAEFPVRARETAAGEAERLWPRLVAIWPAYEQFANAGGRRTIFVLTPQLGSDAALARR